MLADVRSVDVSVRDHFLSVFGSVMWLAAQCDICIDMQSDYVKFLRLLHLTAYPCFVDG